MSANRPDDQRPRTPPASPRDRSPSGGAYAGLGLQFALSILLFLFLGQWLDKRLGTSPWLLILGVFIGAAAGFYSIYRKLMADQKRDDEARGRR